MPQQKSNHTTQQSYREPAGVEVNMTQPVWRCHYCEAQFVVEGTTWEYSECRASTLSAGKRRSPQGSLQDACSEVFKDNLGTNKSSRKNPWWRTLEGEAKISCTQQKILTTPTCMRACAVTYTMGIHVQWGDTYQRRLIVYSILGNVSIDTNSTNSSED